MALQHRKVVLVVDDNADVRTSLAFLLGIFGFAVDTAQDGRSTLDYLSSHPPPCLIVLDLRMAGMDGFQFLDARRGDPAVSRIPVVVCSAEPGWALRDGLGDAAYVPKASDPMRLIHAVLARCA